MLKKQHGWFSSWKTTVEGASIWLSSPPPSPKKHLNRQIPPPFAWLGSARSDRDPATHSRGSESESIEESLPLARQVSQLGAATLWALCGLEAAIDPRESRASRAARNETQTDRPHPRFVFFFFLFFSFFLLVKWGTLVPLVWW